MTKLTAPKTFTSSDASPLDVKAARASGLPAALYAARDYLLSGGAYSEDGRWVAPDGRLYGISIRGDDDVVVYAVILEPCPRCGALKDDFCPRCERDL